MNERKELPGSLMEMNSKEFIASAEFEQEWNQFGLQSGLSREEYRNKKRQKLITKFSEQIKNAAQKAREEGDALDKNRKEG